MNSILVIQIPSRSLIRRALSMIVAIVFATSALMGLVSCNTTAGIGRDLQQAGANIEESARENSAATR